MTILSILVQRQADPWICKRKVDSLLYTKNQGKKENRRIKKANRDEYLAASHQINAQKAIIL